MFTYSQFYEEYEAKIKEMCEMNQVTQDSQNKGECQLRDLAESIKFFNEKFHKLEKDNRNKEEQMKKQRLEI